MGPLITRAVDVHVHLLSEDMIRENNKLRARDPYFDLLCTNPKNAFATAEQALSSMDESGVEISVIFSFAFADIGACREGNDYIIHTLRKYPGRFIGFCCVPPRDPGALKEVVRCREAGLVGVGELFPDGQRFDITDDRQIGALVGQVQECSMYLMVHCNELVGHSYAGKGGTGPEQAYRLAVNYPNVPMIFPHWGGGLIFYETMPEVRKALQHVRYDTAADPFLYTTSAYRAAASAGLTDKIVFGSDYPLLSPRRYFERLQDSGLGPEDIARITSGNAREFLKL